MTKEKEYKKLYGAIVARYPAVAGQGHLVPEPTLRRMIMEVRRGGDLWPWVPEFDDHGNVDLVWGLATPPHPSQAL